MALIAAEQEHIRHMRDDLEKEKEVRSLVLNRNQMICIPYGLGITGDAFGKNKSVYFNNFEYSSFFVQEADNIKAADNIRNFVIFPIIGHNGEPNGVM